MAYSDYIYANKDDSIRVRIFQRGNKRWDFDVYKRKSDSIETYSHDAGDDFRTKKEALEEANRQHPGLKTVKTKDTWTD